MGSIVSFLTLLFFDREVLALPSSSLLLSSVGSSGGLSWVCVLGGGGGAVEGPAAAALRFRRLAAFVGLAVVDGTGRVLELLCLVVDGGVGTAVCGVKACISPGLGIGPREVCSVERVDLVVTFLAGEGFRVVLDRVASDDDVVDFAVSFVGVRTSGGGLWADLCCWTAVISSSSSGMVEVDFWGEAIFFPFAVVVLKHTIVCEASGNGTLPFIIRKRRRRG